MPEDEQHIVAMVEGVGRPPVLASQVCGTVPFVQMHPSQRAAAERSRGWRLIRCRSSELAGADAVEEKTWFLPLVDLQGI